MTRKLSVKQVRSSSTVFLLVLLDTNIRSLGLGGASDGLEAMSQSEAGSFQAADTDRFAMGSFAPLQDGLTPLQRLARVLQARDQVEQRELLRRQGVEDDAFAAALYRAADRCRRAFALYSTPGEVSISFNGGKDACVVLYLWLAIVLAAGGDGQVPATMAESATGSRVQVVFFKAAGEMPSVHAFVDWAVGEMQLSQVTVDHGSFRDGMASLVEAGLRAVVMGQRKGDPRTEGLDAFTPSSEGWPAFMRINPIIDWSYQHVWTFLRTFQLPYCALYDEGYTSLGNYKATARNPALLREDGSYAPAYTLKDEHLERNGRLDGHRSAAKAEM